MKIVCFDKTMKIRNVSLGGIFGEIGTAERRDWRYKNFVTVLTEDAGDFFQPERRSTKAMDQDNARFLCRRFRRVGHSG